MRPPEPLPLSIPAILGLIGCCALMVAYLEELF